MSEAEEELSAQAQALLEQHRLQGAPGDEQSRRVWDRVYHSAFVAPVATAASTASSALPDAAQVAGQAVGTTTQGVAAGAAKGGLLASTTAKVALATTLGGAAAGTVALQSAERSEAPERVQAPSLESSPARSVDPLAKQGHKLRITTQAYRPPRAPSLDPEPSSPRKRIAAPRAFESLTSELAKKLEVLEAIDRSLRRDAFKSARSAILDFQSRYPNSEFDRDIAAMKLLVDCRSDTPVSRKRVANALGAKKYRRYWSRIKQSCAKSIKRIK